MALQRQLKEVHFGAGLNTKGDDRAQPEQLLDVAVNVEFDDVGGLRCRYPFDGVRSSLVGGGTLANARRFARLGDELVCFTQDRLYSWVPAEAGWADRGEHLAVVTDEETVFATPGDQDYADRAELNGQIVYCWQTAAEGVRIAVRDKASGAVVQGPTTITPAGHSYVQPRLVALDNCVLLFCIDFGVPPVDTYLVVGKITLGPCAFTAAGSPLATSAGSPSRLGYDVCRIPGEDRCYAVMADSTTAGDYTIVSVDSSFAGASATSSESSGGVAMDGPICIAISPDAAFATVVTGNNAGGTGVVRADVWTVTSSATPPTTVSTLTNVDLGLTVSGAATQCTAAYRLTQDGGEYRCYVFWTYGETDSAAFRSASNWIDATGTTGTAVFFVHALGIAARAFARDSHVYLVGAFAGLSLSYSDPTGTHSELQNTYYLYRDDAFLIGKAVWGDGGGLRPAGWLSNVVQDADDADAFVLMGGIRRIVPVGRNSDPAFVNYAERSPREITFTFDDDRARRCVQFGETLYVLGSIVLQYDGVQLVELGFCTYPWLLSISAGGAGSIPAAGYSYKATDRWTNGKGEIDRSTTATVSNFTSGTTQALDVKISNLYITRKAGVAIEAWRTAADPAAGAPFFLVTAQDPSVTTGNNAYLTSDPTTIVSADVTDDLTDAELTVLTANPENVGVLPAIEPPPATIAYSDSRRIYLAGIPGSPNTVYYSKYRQAGLVAAFSDALTFDTPADGGAITAIGTLDGALIVWCETATYVFAGVGYDDTGGGSNFEIARTLSTDLGCVGPDAAAFTDDGFVVKTSKGWFLLDRGLGYQYIGAGVAKYDDETPLAMTVLTKRHQVRILTSARILVFDTLVKQWAETSISDGLDMMLWNGAPAYLTATGVRAELATWDGYDGSDASLTVMDVEGGWIKFGAMQARAIVDAVQLLGEYRSSCKVRVRLARDYQATAESVWNYHTDKTWTPSPTTVGNALQVKQGPRYRRCESIKTRITVTHADGVSPLAGPCVRLTSLAIPFALEPNPYGALAAAQKQ